MDKPRLLDLFCCAGGAGMGYHRAGFEVVGVDIKPQPRYPFEFYRSDALEFVQDHSHEFDAIHASPPCQGYSDMSNCRPGLAGQYERLVDDARRVLAAAKLPWVIENVVGAPLAGASDLFGNHGAILCGQMFRLNLYRHRVFEASFPIIQPRHPKHVIPASKAGHWKPGTIISVCGNCAPIAVSREAMGIDWMVRKELSQAIPPAYTTFIGEQLISALRASGRLPLDSSHEHRPDISASLDRKTDYLLYRDVPLGNESYEYSVPATSEANGENFHQ